ncbi:UNVERIFIED_CONTAM: hypothetical protein K2H54_004941 [Gekko kuhli]
MKTWSAGPNPVVLASGATGKVEAVQEFKLSLIPWQRESDFTAQPSLFNTDAPELGGVDVDSFNGVE